MFRYVLAALTIGIGLVGVQGASGQPPAVTWTVITLEKLHCPHCAKKVVTKLKEVPGVADAQTHLETRTAKVTHQNGVLPSPRGLWEAVERAGQRPLRLQGPKGTFASKPSL